MYNLMTREGYAIFCEYNSSGSTSTRCWIVVAHDLLQDDCDTTCPPPLSQMRGRCPDAVKEAATLVYTVEVDTELQFPEIEESERMGSIRLGPRELCSMRINIVFKLDDSENEAV